MVNQKSFLDLSVDLKPCLNLEIHLRKNFLWNDLSLCV